MKYPVRICREIEDTHISLEQRKEKSMEISNFYQRRPYFRLLPLTSSVMRKWYNCWNSKAVCRCSKKPAKKPTGGGGGLPYETDGDARRLA